MSKSRSKGSAGKHAQPSPRRGGRLTTKQRQKNKVIAQACRITVLERALARAVSRVVLYIALAISVILIYIFAINAIIATYDKKTPHPVPTTQKQTIGARGAKYKEIGASHGIGATTIGGGSSHGIRPSGVKPALFFDHFKKKSAGNVVGV